MEDILYSDSSAPDNPTNKDEELLINTPQLKDITNMKCTDDEHNAQEESSEGIKTENNFFNE